MSKNQQPSKPDKPSAPKNSTSKKSGNFLIGLLALLALLLTGGGIAAGYQAWLDMNKRMDQATVDRQSIAREIKTMAESTKLQDFKKQMDRNASSLSQEVKHLSNKLQKQTDMQQHINLTAQETLALVNRSQLDWGLKEVEHVLRMANHRLRIERDLSGSIAALSAANKRLNELNDPRLLPVRKSISKQIGKLKNFSFPDWVDISLQIDNVLGGLRQNVIKEARSKAESSAQKKQDPIDKTEVRRWKKLVDNMKNSINNSIHVTREEQRLNSLIRQQEGEHTHEYLRGRLLNARYAVASREDEAYHRELKAALTWLESNDIGSSKRKIISELKWLNDIDLEPELPDITEANTLLLKILAAIEEN